MPIKPPPQFIKIGPHTFRLLLVPSEEIEGSAFGTFRSAPDDGDVIHIAQESLPARQATTLVHELGHALMHGVGNPLQMPTEELICDVFAAGLTQFWQDNPKVLTWYCKAIQKP